MLVGSAIRNGRDKDSNYTTSPYAELEVKLDGLTGNSTKDAKMANEAFDLATTPEGYNWHHAADGQTMQLVPESINQDFSHTGGAAIIREQNKNSTP